MPGSRQGQEVSAHGPGDDQVTQGLLQTVQRGPGEVVQQVRIQLSQLATGRAADVK